MCKAFHFGIVSKYLGSGSAFTWLICQVVVLVLQSFKPLGAAPTAHFWQIVLVNYTTGTHHNGLPYYP